MKRNKEKIINFDFFLLFVLCFIWSSILNNHIAYILLLLPAAIYIFFKIHEIKILLWILLISFIPIILNIFIKEFNVFNHLNLWLDNLFHFSLRKILINKVNADYNEKTASIINLFIFNIKDSYAYTMYNTIINLSIVHLFVISGLHLSIIKKIFTKKLWFLSYPIIFFYTYLLNFSVSSTRVILTFLFDLLFKKIKTNLKDSCSCAGILSLIIFPKSVTNYGFQMSYFCTLAIISINELKINNWLIKYLLIDFISITISFPFILEMNNSISLFTLINGYLFTFISIVILFIFQITFWMNFLLPMQTYLVILLINILNCVNLFNAIINVKFWSQIYTAISLTIISCSFIILKNLKK